MDDSREPLFSDPSFPIHMIVGGHGTHVSGIIGAKSNNTIGISGMNPHVKIMALRGLSGDGQGYGPQLAALVSYASFNNAKVINMSWGVLRKVAYF